MLQPILGAFRWTNGASSLTKSNLNPFIINELKINFSIL